MDLPSASSPASERSSNPVPVVGVGASAGGIEAIEQFLSALPPDCGVAVVVVLHLSPTHESQLAAILARATRMRVTEVHDEPQVEPNVVYVIPPARTMVIQDGHLRLLPRPPGGGGHRPVDDFFSSLAQMVGSLAIGVILSGTGNDGTAGLVALKAEGGITFAQDATAQQDSMPRSAIAAGCVDFVMSPPQIAAEVARIVHHPYAAQLSEHAAPEQLAEPTDFERILSLLRLRTGVNFSQYKFNTLFRRVHRRMLLRRHQNLKEYAEDLQKHASEVDALYQDILISVTNFFRNPDAFDALKAKVFPALTRERERHDPVRVWVIGCSTGEEAYSVAIVLSEYLSAVGSSTPVQLYATDLNGSAIEKARLGFYPRSIVQDISPERLRRYFVETDGGYRIGETIREMCVFARQNILADPLFSRMDLICCRNVLIYIEPRLQRKLVPLLHYALKPRGFLFLGSSETIGSYRDLFELVDGKHKIYSKKLAPVRLEAPLLAVPATSGQTCLDQHAERPRESNREAQAETQREIDRLLMSRYVPASVLVNGDFEILQFRGDTGRYLTPAPGKASLNLLKMTREGLMVSLRAALHRAKKEDNVAREDGLRVRANGGFIEVNVVVMPIRGQSESDRSYLVLFEDASHFVRQTPAPAPLVPESGQLEDKDKQIARLTQELTATREYLQSVIEQQEAANEELQSANEEVQSANEELQSINEELETSKEEIQSSNEELTTVNEELQNRNEELARANNDLNNLLASVQMAIVMVWPDLRIRRFTPAAEKLLNLISADVGRPISDIKLNIDVPDIIDMVRDAIDSVTARELDVRDNHGRWYSLRIRPYRTMENKIDGAVIMLIDIHESKQVQEAVARQARLLELTLEPIMVRKIGGEITYWNRGAELLYGYSKEEAIGRSSHDLLDTKSPNGVMALEQELEHIGRFVGELQHRTKDGRQIIVESHMVLVREHDQSTIIEVNRDITERKELEETLKRRVSDLAAANEQKNQFVAMLAHELRNPLAPMRNAIEIMKARGDDPSVTLQLRDLLDRQITKMSHIVNDLLSAARATRGRVELRKKPLALQPVLEHSVDLVRSAASARGQGIELSLPAEPLIVDADPLRLEQVFSNLLENAVKFSPDNGKIWVSARVSEPAEGCPKEIAISVRDSGIGIAPALLPRVFDLFVQADDSLARSQGGLGIGLSLVRSLVESHGGRVGARSEGIGRGSEFTVWLPLLDRSPTPETSAPVSSTEQRLRVLVVDDNEDCVSSVKALLELSGHEVRTAYRGTDAVNVAREFEPDVVLLDIGLPEMDGYEVARRLRADPKLAHVLLLALTGYGEESDERRAREAGFDHHLVKPISVDILTQYMTEAKSHRQG